MHLVDCQINSDYKREGNDEVDYIITQGEKTVGIEVKSGLQEVFR